MNVAFIGLGVMGFPMAGHLSSQGHRVRVYNRTRARAEYWTRENEGDACATPAEAAENADVALICVGNDDDVRSVVYGENGVLQSLRAGAVLVDHTTTSALLAEELAEACRAQHVGFLDAPVSGGQAGAENGRLTVMCGGDELTFTRIRPMLEAYSANVTRLGVAGQGQRAKMVNQVCIAGVLQGLSEGLRLAEKAGLNIPDLVNTLKHGAAGSWQMENRAITMSEEKFDFGFAIDWMRKDLGFAMEEARRYNLPLPMTETVDQAYARLQARGHGRSDTSALILDLNRHDDIAASGSSCTDENS